MREILFRGKRVDNGEWVYGNFIEDKWGDDNGNTIYAILQDRVAPDIAELWTPVRVIPETVGQFTGLTDKNGKRIFEGDIVVGAYGMKGLVEFFTEDIGSCGCCVPQFDGSGFKAKYKNLDSGVDMRSCTIVGNIYDNPEMWEVGNENTRRTD